MNVGRQAQNAEKVLASDLIVLATPIYSWYCTPPMKAIMDRLVYGLCKYYGDEKEQHAREFARKLLNT